MRIFITGAAGLIGRALRTELSGAGHKLVLADIVQIQKPEGRSMVLDISNGRAVCKAIKNVDAVVHLAYKDQSWKHIWDQDRCFDVNTKGTYYVLAAASQAGVKRFVYTSSLSVFGCTLTLAKMGKLNESTPPKPEAPYGLAKYFGEETCRAFAKERGLSVSCLRLCHVSDDKDWEHWQALKPRNRFDWCWRTMTTHVNDVARAIHCALKIRHKGFELIHIASDHPKQITSIQRSRRLLGFKPQYRFTTRLQ